MIVCTFGENVVKFQVKSEKEELDRSCGQIGQIGFLPNQAVPVCVHRLRSIDRFQEHDFSPREKRGNKREGTLFLELKEEVKHA